MVQIPSVSNNKAAETPSAKLIGDAKQRSGKRSTGYIFLLAVMIIIPIIIASIVSESGSAPETETVASHVDWSAAGGMNIVSLFWMCVCLFGFIGAMRGWAKEMLVTFSGMLALAISFLLVRYLPFLGDLPKNNLSLFWVRLVIMVTLVYFGYQTVATIPALAAKSDSGKLTDVLFGLFTGGINGYLVAGTILAYFHVADYPYQNVLAPATDSVFSEIVTKMMEVMPPNLFGEPSIYFGVTILFIFVIVVYL